MALLKLTAILGAACLIENVIATPVRSQNPVLLSQDKPRIWYEDTIVPTAKPKSSGMKEKMEGSLNVNVTFDSIDLSESSNKTIKSMPLLKFELFQVFNTTSGVENNLMNISDMDCAASYPNSLVSVLSDYNPAIFHIEDKAMNAAGLSKYVDLISFSIKPMIPPFLEEKGINLDGGFMDIYAWELDGHHPNNVHEAFMAWGVSDKGGMPAWHITPSEYIPGWGEKINFVELSASVLDEDYNEYRTEFCLDNLVFEVREKGNDE